MTKDEFLSFPPLAQKAILDEMRDGQALADRWELIARRSLRLAGLCLLGLIITNGAWAWIITLMVGRIGAAQ